MVTFSFLLIQFRITLNNILIVNKKIFYIKASSSNNFLFFFANFILLEL